MLCFSDKIIPVDDGGIQIITNKLWCECLVWMILKVLFLELMLYIVLVS